MVRERGLEPPRLAAHAPKACVSTIPPLAHIVSWMLRRVRVTDTIIRYITFYVNKKLPNWQLNGRTPAPRLRSF